MLAAAWAAEVLIGSGGLGGLGEFIDPPAVGTKHPEHDGIVVRVVARRYGFEDEAGTRHDLEKGLVVAADMRLHASATILDEGVAAEVADHSAREPAGLGDQREVDIPAGIEVVEQRRCEGPRPLPGAQRCADKPDRDVGRVERDPQSRADEGGDGLASYDVHDGRYPCQIQAEGAPCSHRQPGAGNPRARRERISRIRLPARRIA
ncbi:MAG: hypothetical protein AB7P12_19840 [Alphaproteobacteria bacterium]